jgi:hypothetical protein
VDQPLDADTGAAVRHLCRRLCALRASCSAAAGDAHGDASGTAAAASEALPSLNLLLAVAGEYFGAARGLYQ